MTLVLLGTAFAQDLTPDEQGDLIVSEFMAEPQKVPDYYGEWFEITNVSGKLKDLNGLVVEGSSSGELVALSGSLLLEHESSLVLGVHSDTGDNGNVAIDVEYSFADFSMNRSGDTIRLTYNGNTVDELIWTSAWNVPSVSSFQVGPQGYGEWANDLNNNWCNSDRYIDGGVGLFGTPGEENDYCNDAGEDADGDGYSEQEGDCDDSDPYVNPGAVDGTEDPFGEADDDADCDNERDDGLVDNDGDGFTGVDGDCNDDDLNINPSKSEGKDADGIDNDCNCWIDDIDADGDSYPNFDDADYVGYSDPKVEELFCDPEDVGDCVDDGVIDGVSAVDIHPGATETPYNGVDEDCDGVDLCDVDGDGYDSIECDAGGDCDDDNPDIHPGAPDATSEPDGLDNDCDGIIDSPDRDGDKYMVADGDCDDNNPDVNPGVAEQCDDFLDNNCDGFYNEGCDYPAFEATVQGGSLIGCSALSSSRPAGLVLLFGGLLLILRRR